jgi:hypothetical protein
MDSIARENLSGSGGSKALLFFLSHPRGAVTTISSNTRVRPLSVETDMLFEQDMICVTLVESSILAPSSAGAAILARISLYVPAANRFSNES